MKLNVRKMSNDFLLVNVRTKARVNWRQVEHLNI